MSSTLQRARLIIRSRKKANSGSPNADQEWYIRGTAATSGDPDIYADLSKATGITVNELREYFALQRYSEARAIYGSRYTEYLAYLGVRSSDARLQRPEYVGGGKATIAISEVLQTASDVENTSPVGTLRGHGIAGARTSTSRKFAEEHGYVMTLMSVVPKSVYMDGTDRHWSKAIKEDYWQRELEHVGQQAIYNQEVYFPVATEPKGTFGYSDRYAEYRSGVSLVTGEFRDLLDYWHLAREFESMPVLNESFIQCVPSKRIFAEQTQNSLWCAINNRTVARRLVGRSTIGRVQ